MTTNKKSSFSKILVPLDGSKYSEKALLRAIELVTAFDSEIILLYVIEKIHPVNFLDRNEYDSIRDMVTNKWVLLISKRGKVEAFQYPDHYKSGETTWTGIHIN